MSNKIIYEDYAVGASDYAQVTSNTNRQMDGNNDPYNIDCLFGDDGQEYVSFDNGGIDLSKDARIYSASTDKVGYVSDRISDHSGRFTSPPCLEIEFLDNNTVKTFSGNGITIHFAESYCTDVRVTYTLSDNTTVQEEYNNIQSKEAYLPKTVKGYKKIKIEFLATQNPLQYAKVYKVEFGHTTVIDKFRSISFNKKLDFYGSDISIGTMDVSFLSDVDMNFYENQKMKLYHNEELIGTYWVSESERQTNRLYSVTCEDVLSRLDNKDAPKFFSEDAGVISGTPNYGYPIQTILNAVGEVAAVELTGDGTVYEDEDDRKHVKGYFESGSYRLLLAETIFAFEKHTKAKPDGSLLVFDPVNTSAKVISESKIIGNADYRDVTRPVMYSVVADQYYQPWQPSGSGEPVASGAVITPTAETIRTSFPAVGLEVKDNNGDLVSKSRYTVTKVTDYSFTIQSSSDEVIYPVAIFGCPYAHSDYTFSKDRSSYSGERNEQKAFGRRVFYRTDKTSWINSLANRVFSVVGEVRAKIITDNIDIGDYVKITTKYSGDKYGTVTEINADVGYSDIVKDVVITVWQ